MLQNSQAPVGLNLSPFCLPYSCPTRSPTHPGGSDKILCMLLLTSPSLAELPITAQCRRKANYIVRGMKVSLLKVWRETLITRASLILCLRVCRPEGLRLGSPGLGVGQHPPQCLTSWGPTL